MDNNNITLPKVELAFLLAGFLAAFCFLGYSASDSANKLEDQQILAQNYEREIAKYSEILQEKNSLISNLSIHNKLLNFTAPTSIYKTSENTYQSFVNKDGSIIVTNFFVNEAGNISTFSVE